MRGSQERMPRSAWGLRGVSAGQQGRQRCQHVAMASTDARSSTGEDRATLAVRGRSPGAGDRRDAARCDRRQARRCRSCTGSRAAPRARAGRSRRRVPAMPWREGQCLTALALEVAQEAVAEAPGTWQWTSQVRPNARARASCTPSPGSLTSHAGHNLQTRQGRSGAQAHTRRVWSAACAVTA